MHTLFIWLDPINNTKGHTILGFLSDPLSFFLCNHVFFSLFYLPNHDYIMWMFHCVQRMKSLDLMLVDLRKKFLSKALKPYYCIENRIK